MDNIYGINEEFELIDEKLFDSLSEIKPEFASNEKYNYCPDCNIAMILDGTEYHCDHCGRMQLFTVDTCKDHGDTSNTPIRITTGVNKGRFYNISSDYTKTQKKFILDQLLQNQTSFTGMAFPTNVMNAVANQYNSIQKFITEDDIDESGKVRGQKKFVRRGNIKDEVLAGLIYFECIREKLVRKKKDIAVFMHLPTFGFSRGEDILRNLHAEGKLDIPCDEEPIEGFVDRYLEALNMEEPTGRRFIIELVEESEKRKIQMSSQLSSKIVGSLWILITKRGLKITPQEVERCADGIKKNTFMKFCKAIQDNMHTFAPIFIRNDVPYK